MRGPVLFAKSDVIRFKAYPKKPLLRRFPYGKSWLQIINFFWTNFHSFVTCLCFTGTPNGKSDVGCSKASSIRRLRPQNWSLSCCKTTVLLLQSRDGLSPVLHKKCHYRSFFPVYFPSLFSLWVIQYHEMVSWIPPTGPPLDVEPRSERRRNAPCDRRKRRFFVRPV